MDEQHESHAASREVAPRAGPLRSASVILIACCCGWLVMELEILGARLLQPHFGSDIYVTWGSVIGVFLLSLSIGYMLGGWLSRKRSSQLILGVDLLVAGAWLCLVPWASAPVCNALFDAGLDEKAGSLLAALALFAVPTVLLGTVSPTAVRWLTSTATESGLKAGLVLSLSTVASFAGCVVTAFYLIEFSLSSTLRISGALLGALGLAIALHALLRRTGSPRGAAEGEETPLRSQEETAQ